ncbi:hypothetical protein I656_01484 [Geobacillus sp. WSUCF1]|nr:hypothetical protein I656_01484 [Geobacillus sp. WSUCF1]
MQFESLTFVVFTERLDRLSGERTMPLPEPCMGLRSG